jgi:hypothetical protein
MDNYMATRSYSPTDPTPTSDSDADFDIDEHDETDDEFSEEGSEFVSGAEIAPEVRYHWQEDFD